MIPVRFVAPWLLLFIPMGIAFLVWGERQSYVRLSGIRRRSLFLVRALTLTLLTVALAVPSVTWKTREPSVVLLVDVSASMTDGWLEEAQRYARALTSQHPQDLEVVTFARHPRRVPRSPEGPRIARHADGETNLSEALLFASGLSPRGPPRILLLSDGNDPRAVAAARRVADSGVQIDVVKLTGATPVDARVTAIGTSNALRQHQPTRFAITVEATRAGRATLRFEENDLVVKELPDQLLKPGVQTLEVTHEPSTGDGYAMPPGLSSPVTSCRATIDSSNWSR